MTTLSSNVETGLRELGEIIDLGDLRVSLSIDRSSIAADTVLDGDVLRLRVNDVWAAGRTDGQLAWLGEHEGLHNWFRTDNPAFKEWAVWQREGGGIVWLFHGPEAMAENGGRPVRVTPTGHLADYTGLVMSEAWHEVDGPQPLSRLELAMLRDMGVTVWSPTQKIVNTVYHEVLGRAADSAGLDYWVGVLESGAVSEWDLWAAVLGGAQGETFVEDARVELVGVL